MLLKGEHLAGHLERGLQSIYVVYGEEPLLVIEAADAIRAAARRQGFDEREVLTAIAGFNWNELTQSAGNLSLFVREDAELLPPFAVDDQVLISDVLGKEWISVDVMENDYDLDGLPPLVTATIRTVTPYLVGWLLTAALWIVRPLGLDLRAGLRRRGGNAAPPAAPLRMGFQ